MIKVLKNGGWVEQEPKVGDRVREYRLVDTDDEHFIEYTLTANSETQIRKYRTTIDHINANDEEANRSFGGNYLVSVNDSVDVKATINEGDHITFPGAVLKLPVVRYADDLPTTDEIYWDATIVEGVMRASGTFPRSGAWKFTQDRINKAIKREMPAANWQIETSDITFVV